MRSFVFLFIQAKDGAIQIVEKDGSLSEEIPSSVWPKSLVGLVSAITFVPVPRLRPNRLLRSLAAIPVFGNTAKLATGRRWQGALPSAGRVQRVGLGLFGGAGMQSEAGAMLTDTLLFLAQVVCCDACERSGGIRQGAGMRQEFPSAGALQDAPGQSFWPVVRSRRRLRVRNSLSRSL